MQIRAVTHVRQNFPERVDLRIVLPENADRITNFVMMTTCVPGQNTGVPGKRSFSGR
jgi:hypothetical protein